MRTTLILAVFLALSFSCNKSKNCDKPEPDCSSVNCVHLISTFEFKLVDKTTGADLVFGNNPRYTSADIKIFSDLGRSYPLPLIFDNDKKLIRLVNAKTEMYLVIKTTDAYKLTAEFRTEICCSIRVKTLWQDGEMVCSCCPDAISLSVR